MSSGIRELSSSFTNRLPSYTVSNQAKSSPPISAHNPKINNTYTDSTSYYKVTLDPKGEEAAKIYEGINSFGKKNASSYLAGINVFI